MVCQNQKNEHGFTIVEMLISVAIGMLIIGITVTMFNAQRKAFSLQEELSEMTQNARIAMNMISRDVRMAGYNAGGTLTVSGADTIEFLIKLFNFTPIPVIIKKGISNCENKIKKSITDAITSTIRKNKPKRN